MSDIIKTEAVVLNKINYSDSSNIASLFTPDQGKISVIIKGGRAGKTKLGAVINPATHLNIIYYNKQTRDLQILTSAEIISHYPNIKEDLNRLEYTFAVLELIKELMAENEANLKIFNGLTRILERINLANEHPAISFGRFFLFFAREIGYELQLNYCSVCKKIELRENNMAYNYETGMICGKCNKEAVEFYAVNMELFQYLNCLKSNKEADSFGIVIVNKANRLIENHLKYHIPTFKGINTFKIFSKR